MIDRQKVYNRVRRHLLTQNRVSANGTGCLYRTYDPNTRRVLKCAVGCLIPFRHYNPAMEEISILADEPLLHEALASSLPGFSSEDLDFLYCLQEIHDACNPEDWQDRLDAVAERYGLKVPA